MDQAYNDNENRQQYYVNSNHIKYKEKYVCWIDIMGTKNTMLESNAKAANFILKFHLCVLTLKEQFEGKDIRFYPVMDGVYITAGNSQVMCRMLRIFFRDLADMFCIDAKENRHRFVVRGAIAYGSVLDGLLIKSDVCQMTDDYKERMLLGLLVIQAFQSEREAPPFGLYIHESARKPQELQGRYYVWFNGYNNHEKLYESTISYFDWCRANRLYLQLDAEKIDRYQEQLKEYFHFQQDNIGSKDKFYITEVSQVHKVN